uniref:ribosomal protein S3 n=1 Tax=Hypnea flava TaxID=1524266 RepID=UPI003002D6A3|nr:ribosomal protein S3 [Hypnea flava]
MAQKINPTGVRLGISQLWVSSIQFYGRSFKSYFLLLQYYIRSFLFLKKLSNVTGFLINYQQWRIKKSNDIALNIYYTQSFFAVNNNFVKFYNQIQNTLGVLFKKRIGICFYLTASPFLSKNLLYSYSQFLTRESLVAKKILWSFSKLLSEHLNSLRLISTPQGLKISKLKGFKIQLVGRLDDSKTQMAKSLNLNIGNLGSTSLGDFIVYSASALHSKSGTCGLKIWLFYELVQ